MTLDKATGGSEGSGGGAMGTSPAHAHRTPKKLIFAPGDIAAPYHLPSGQHQQQRLTTTSSNTQHPAMPTPIPAHLQPTLTTDTTPESPLR
ncbi:hypothetical protein EMPG_16140, partial [Blastomyces silverae]